jgi:nucleotide-binding universal stress UspA family protein
MKVLVPLDASRAARAALDHVHALSLNGMPVQAVLLHVQPRFHRHIAQFTTRTARDALRAERSAAALAPAVEKLTQWRLPFVALTEIGAPADCIARVAEREAADEIVMGVGRHPAWMRALNPSIAEAVSERTDIPVTVLARGRAGALERYVVPAGLAGIAALLWAVE